MVLASERKRTSLREWRIWPLLASCAGTQLAYAILHMVVKDFFACILTLFSFIGSLCCIVSRRSEVVLANLLLQLVIFTALFICCCLGTSSLQMWHENKKLAPLIATQILFFAAVLLLNAVLLALKKQQQRRDAVAEESACANRKLLFGRTESSATMDTRSPSSPHTFFRLQRQREEQQAQSEQGQKHETYSGCIPICADADKSCRAGANLLSADISCSMTQRNPSSLYNRELSGIYQSPDSLGENENEGEASPTLTVYRAARPGATSHLVIRSQQIEAAGNSQHHSAPDRSGTLQTVGSRRHNSCYSATPVINQQNCILHGRALYSVSTGQIRTFDGGRRTAQAGDAPALPRCAIAEDIAAVGAAASPSVCLVDYEHQQNAATVALTAYPATPRRCLKCHFHNRSISCSCPPQTSGAFPPSSIPSLHSCVSLNDGGTGCGAASLEQKDLSYRPASTGKHKCFLSASIKKTVRRCWETTLTYLGQPVDCDSVLEAANENLEKLQKSGSTTRVTPGRNATEESSPKVEGRGRREPPEEFLSISRNLYHCRRTSIEASKISVSAEDTYGTQVICTDMKDVGKDGDRDGKDDEVEEPEAPKQQKIAIALECVQESKRNDDGGTPPSAVPLECILQPFKSMHRQKSRNSCVNRAACTSEGSTSAANEGSKQMAETHDIGALSGTEVRTEREHHITLEQSGNQEEGSGHRVSSAAPASACFAAELGTEDVASSGEVISKQGCAPLEFSPAAARGAHERYNEQTHLGALEMREGPVRTVERQRRRSATEVAKGEERPEYVLQSPRREYNALFSNELMARSRSTEVFAKLWEAASSVEVTEVDNLLPQLEKIDNHSSGCEAENKHGVLSTSIITDTHVPLQKVGTSFSTRYALPPAETFNRLPSSAISVDKECAVDGERAVDAQFSDVGQSVEECGQAAHAGENVQGQFPSTVETAALTVTLEQLPPICLGEEPQRKEPLVSGQGEPHSLVCQPRPSGGKCIPAERRFTATGEDSVGSENYAFSRNNDKNPLGTAAAREVIVSKFSSEKQGYVEVGRSIDVSCGQTDTIENGSENGRATAEATRVTSSAIQASFACKGETLVEAKCYDERSALKLNTAGAHNVDDIPVSFTRRKASTTEEVSPVGGGVSREKVVYRDHLKRELTSNTTPRAEEEDSWEDESEETEGQSQTDVLTRREGDGGSEWELSDVSEAGIRSVKRPQGRGTHRNQRSRYLPSEVRGVYGRRTVRKKDRACRTNC